MKRGRNLGLKPAIWGVWIALFWPKKKVVHVDLLDPVHCFDQRL